MEHKIRTLVCKAGKKIVETGLASGIFSGITTGSITADDEGYTDGTWFIHVQAIDKAGNLSAVKTVYAVLDNSAPDLPKIIAGTTATNDTTPTWTWDSGGGTRVFRYKLDDSSLESIRYGRSIRWNERDRSWSRGESRRRPVGIRLRGSRRPGRPSQWWVFCQRPRHNGHSPVY